MSLLLLYKLIGAQLLGSHIHELHLNISSLCVQLLEGLNNGFTVVSVVNEGLSTDVEPIIYHVSRNWGEGVRPNDYQAAVN